MQEATLGRCPHSPPKRTPHHHTPGSRCLASPPTSALSPPGHAPEHDSGLRGGGVANTNHFDNVLHWLFMAMGTRGFHPGQPTKADTNPLIKTAWEGLPLTLENCLPVQPGLTHGAARLNYLRRNWLPQKGQGQACPPATPS